jgi:hypothetical protein
MTVSTAKKRRATPGSRAPAIAAVAKGDLAGTVLRARSLRCEPLPTSGVLAGGASGHRAALDRVTLRFNVLKNLHCGIVPVVHGDTRGVTPLASVLADGTKTEALPPASRPAIMRQTRRRFEPARRISIRSAVILTHGITRSARVRRRLGLSVEFSA